MLLEALVITICANGYDGCSQTTSAYYEQSKELQSIAKNVDKLGKKIVSDHEWLVYIGTPAYAIAARKPAKILIFKGTTINVDPWQRAIGLQWSYS